MEKGGPLARQVDGTLLGEIVVMMPRRTLNFRHQKEYFEASKGSSLKVWKPDAQTFVVAWINQGYRRENPMPIGVDECFVAWALETAGRSAIGNFDALRRVFPASCRNVDERANELLFNNQTDCEFCLEFSNIKTFVKHLFESLSYGCRLINQFSSILRQERRRILYQCIIFMLNSCRCL